MGGRGTPPAGVTHNWRVTLITEGCRGVPPPPYSPGTERKKVEFLRRFFFSTWEILGKSSPMNCQSDHRVCLWVITRGSECVCVCAHLRIFFRQVEKKIGGETQLFFVRDDHHRGGSGDPLVGQVNVSRVNLTGKFGRNGGHSVRNGPYSDLNRVYSELNRAHSHLNRVHSNRNGTHSG
jgi:hypothetical protein